MNLKLRLNNTVIYVSDDSDTHYYLFFKLYDYLADISSSDESSAIESLAYCSAFL